MGFLDDLLKDVEDGIDRVAKGADKLLSDTNIRSEIEALKRDQRGLLAEIGEEAVALYAAGEIQLPGMSMQIAQLRDIQGKIEDLQAQLEQSPARAAAASAVAAEPASESASAASPASEASPARAATPAFCPECGAQLTEGAAFCAECGNRVT